MKENDKVNLFIQYLIRLEKFNSQEDVGKLLGYDNKSSFSQILKKPITPTFKNKFLRHFPEYENFIIGINDEKINMFDIEKFEKSNLIPLYDDVSTYGSHVDEMEMKPVITPTEYIDAGTWFGNTKITAAIRHYGESMTEYPNGCILALKEIHDFDNVFYGRNYVIETDEIRVTKRIQSANDETKIMAYSTNTDTYPDGKQIHEPFPIKKSKIKKVLLVVGRIVKEHDSGSILTL